MDAVPVSGSFFLLPDLSVQTYTANYAYHHFIVLNEVSFSHYYQQDVLACHMKFIDTKMVFMLIDIQLQIAASYL